MSLRTLEQKAADELKALKDQMAMWAERLEHFAESKTSAMASEALLHEIAQGVCRGIKRVAQDIRDRL